MVEESDETIEEINEDVPGKTTLTAIPDLNVDINVLDEEIKKKLIEHVEEKGFTVENIDVSAGSQKGDNFFGFIRKLLISAVDRNDGSSVTFDWIAKTSPIAEIYRKTLNAELIYKREIYVYEKFFPLIKKYQKDRGILEPFDCYPGYVTSYDIPMKETIIMEDMKVRGYVMRSKSEPLDLQHAKLAMKTYGKLHALSYALRKHEPDAFKELTENTRDVIECGMRKEDIFRMHQPLISQILNVFDGEKDAAIVRKLKVFGERFHDIYYDTMGNANEFYVIGHSDSWMNNMLWRYDDPNNSKSPTKLCLLDWQITRYGSPSFDIHYFLFLCTDKSLREKHYGELVKLYYYELCAQLNEFDINPEETMTFDDLIGEFKRSTVAILYLSLIVLFMISRDANELPDLNDNVTEEEMKVHISSESRNADARNSRLRDVIVDCYNWGYLDVLL